MKEPSHQVQWMCGISQFLIVFPRRESVLSCTAFAVNFLNEYSFALRLPPRLMRKINITKIAGQSSYPRGFGERSIFSNESFWVFCCEYLTFTSHS